MVDFNYFSVNLHNNRLTLLNSTLTRGHRQTLTQLDSLYNIYHKQEVSLPLRPSSRAAYNIHTHKDTA